MEDQLENAPAEHTNSCVITPMTELQKLESWRDDATRELGQMQKRIDFLKSDPKFAAKLDEYKKLGFGGY